jgi:asparagine synthase (glutamine-hydrolysing)
LIRELAWRDVRGRETCLSGVSGLRGGDHLMIADQGSRVETLWSPWAVISSGDELPPAEMADRVRRNVMACVAARASVFDHVLLLLSGGLDSSILAASLARGRTPFSLATFTTRDPLGDERVYAAAVADAVGQPLHEAIREVARIDLDSSIAARLPRPAGRLFEQESARISGEVASRVGAGAIVTGGGGDNVFCSLQSAAPVADRLLVQGPGKGAFETAREIGRLASARLPAVLWAALGRLPQRHRHSPVEPDVSFLAPEARCAIGRPPHAWLAAPTGALPGTAAHIKLLAAAESFMQEFDPQAALPTIAPLLAQPVVETCLSVPSWCWFRGGLNRAVARRAFAGDLPDRIIRRGSKGSPDSFAAEIYERHRLALRERLLGGVLVAERVLDPAALQASFSQAGALVPAEYRRLLRLADVEAWARGWLGRAG